jgi:uncharacterized protein with PIN domain
MSNNLKRKINRKNQIKDKKATEKQLKKTLKNIFLPDFCKNCNAPFDKTSHEHAQSWRVIARTEEEDKYLLCPVCWDKIQTLISSE